MTKKLLILTALYIIFSQGIYAQDTTQNNAEKTCFYQVSFINPLGTNGRTSGKIKNNLSFNMLSGYNGGLNGFELSLFSGVNNGNMDGCQIAGFSNVNLGKATGTQIGGFSNVNLGYTKGVQISGFSNLIADSAEGVQISGFSNVVNGNYSGAQISGFSNMVKGNSKGALISGFSNVVNGNYSGAQISGFNNVVIGNSNGLQISGFTNIATGNSKGNQISGFTNVTVGESDGAQISGFFNYTRKNKGLQLGFINVADSSEGVSIGFMSIVKQGYYKLNLFTDEMLMANLNYKMGSNKFYNIWGVSANTEMWGLTYGFGTLIRSEKKVSFNIDLSATNMNYKKIFEIQTCMKTKIESDINIKINKKLDLIAGLSYNVFVSDKILDEGLQNYVSKITNSYIKSASFKSVKMLFWPGVTIGVGYRIPS